MIPSSSAALLSKARLHHYSSIWYAETWYQRKVSDGAVIRVGTTCDKCARCLLILTVLLTQQFIFIFVPIYRQSVKPLSDMLCAGRISLPVVLGLWNSLSNFYFSPRFEVIQLSDVLVQDIQLKAEPLIRITQKPTLKVQIKSRYYTGRSCRWDLLPVEPMTSLLHMDRWHHPFCVLSSTLKNNPCTFITNDVLQTQIINKHEHYFCYCLATFTLPPPLPPKYSVSELEPLSVMTLCLLSPRSMGTPSHKHFDLS